MGIKLVKATQQDPRSIRLDHRPFRVLIIMATTALDPPTPPGKRDSVYYRGHHYLASLMPGGKPYPDDKDNSPEAKRIRETRKRAIRKDIENLIGAGLIEAIGEGPYRSHASEYRLLLNVDASAPHLDSAEQPESHHSAPPSHATRPPGAPVKTAPIGNTCKKPPGRQRWQPTNKPRARR
jgi:hypothetical protein